MNFSHEYPMERVGNMYTLTFAAPLVPAALWYQFRIETPDSASGSAG